jgi:hypothetical protein
MNKVPFLTLLATVAGCAPALAPGEADRILANAGLTRADALECRYQATAASANTPGMIEPSAVYNQLFGMCLEARAARAAELRPQPAPVIHQSAPVNASMCGPEITNPHLRAECRANQYDLVLADPPYSVEDAERYQTTMVKRNS